MTDDGKIVRLTPDEYYRLIGMISKSLFDHSGVWDFPWLGARRIYLEPDAPQGEPKWK
jgi:hypothetical protein